MLILSLKIKPQSQQGLTSYPPTQKKTRSWQSQTLAFPGTFAPIFLPSLTGGSIPFYSSIPASLSVSSGPFQVGGS